ncbi:WecB/TagA/CpsF family glycosyltransferase [Deferrisoma camini]|uniref:WecB/TagA/CpsF family glycosyltransferase n=1 Tax=Deferrisoma camini TaxID=1035120 RepID=UPI000A014704
MGRGDNIAIVGGVPVSCYTVKEWVEMYVREAAQEACPDKPRLYTSANGHFVSQVASNSELREVVSCFDGIDADGMSVVFASRIFCHNKIPERVVTTDVFHALARIIQNTKMTVYFLGGEEKTVNTAVANVKSMYPKLNVVGYRNGYFRSENEEEVAVSQIVSLRPTFLFVGMGVPLEQFFVVKHRESLSGVRCIKTCGGMFRVLAGEVRRPPLWVQRAGLEWAYRCIKERGRVIRRYALTNVHAAFLYATRSK